MSSLSGPRYRVRNGETVPLARPAWPHDGRFARFPEERAAVRRKRMGTGVGRGPATVATDAGGPADKGVGGAAVGEFEVRRFVVSQKDRDLVPVRACPSLDKTDVRASRPPVRFRSVQRDPMATPQPHGTSPSLILVVLAAGESSRFGRLKQLMPIGPSGEAFLDYALYDGALAGFTRFLLLIQEPLRPDFEAHLRPAVAAGLDVRYAYQRLSHPELVADPPPGRLRPWGTGFAVLAAGEQVEGPFAVCNADDFYGRGAYAALTAAMREAWPGGAAEAAVVRGAPAGRVPEPGAVGRAPAGGPADAALREEAADSASPSPRAFTVGYPLEATLSESGGVSRGLCDIGASGRLRRLTEALELRRHGRGVCGCDVAGRRIDAPGRTPVCMNLWGFHPQILPPLRDRFAAFLASGPGRHREFHLSQAIDDLVVDGRVRCAVLPTRERWLGVTFPEDHAGVAKSVRKLVDSETYPPSLWSSAPTPP